MTQKSKTTQAASDSEAAEKTTSEPTKSVKVNYAQGKVAEGAGFIHPESKQLITGDNVVEVPADEWTDTMIREKTLTEVR